MEWKIAKTKMMKEILRENVYKIRRKKKKIAKKP
jgi:hypothetical protein